MTGESDFNSIAQRGGKCDARIVKRSSVKIRFKAWTIQCLIIIFYSI